jgi:hypothetical protein
MTYEELKQGTKLNDETLKQLLAQLVKQKVLEEKDENYELNLGRLSLCVCESDLNVDRVEKVSNIRKSSFNSINLSNRKPRRNRTMS